MHQKQVGAHQTYNEHTGLVCRRHMNHVYYGVTTRTCPSHRDTRMSLLEIERSAKGKKLLCSARCNERHFPALSVCRIEGMCDCVLTTESWTPVTPNIWPSRILTFAISNFTACYKSFCYVWLEVCCRTSMKVWVTLQTTFYLTRNFTIIERGKVSLPTLYTYWCFIFATQKTFP